MRSVASGWIPQIFSEDSLFVKDKKLHFTYNCLTRKFHSLVADDELPEGDLTILYEFEATSKGDPANGNGAPGIGTLYVNDRKIGSLEMDVAVPFLFSIEGRVRATTTAIAWIIGISSHRSRSRAASRR